MDLRRQVSRKISKKKARGYKKRADNKHLLGRTHKDYFNNMAENPDVFVTQMDTVYNNETKGLFIQTFKFLCAGILFAIRHDTKTAEAMKTSSDGSHRTRVFYCDPLNSSQKGSLENKHIELRYILPKGTDLNAIGLTDQDALNLALSHVNSSPVEKLGGKSPLELADFMYHDLYEKLAAFGIRQIDKDKIVLKPYLLKK